jgi:hypothetical protein
MRPHDPFTRLLDELQDRDDDPHGWDGLDRRAYLDALLILEAEEIAHGCRHLTIVHGESTHPAEDERLENLHESLRDLLAISALAVRFGGLHDHMAITVEGDNADHWIGLAIDLVNRVNPGHWHLHETAFVVDDVGAF